MASDNCSGRFADAVTAFLTRRAQGLSLTTDDVPLLEAMLAGAKATPVEAALAIDPVWTYVHDAAGNVVSESVLTPASTLTLPGGGTVPLDKTQWTLWPAMDAQGLLTRIGMVVRVGAQVDVAGRDNYFV